MTTTTNQPIVSNALVRRCVAGEDAAWADLFRLIRPIVFWQCYRIWPNMDDAEDVTGDVFVRIMLYIHTYRSDSNFDRWAQRVARNEVLNFIKKRHIRTHISLDAYADDMDIPSDIDMEGDAIKSAVAKVVNDNLSILPAAWGEVVHRRYVMGMEYQEIADRMGTPLNTVRSRLFRAHKRLRERLQPMLEG